jgi:enamine deaminase RidA (YjgF/YER057c/UK114 family)
MRSVNPSSMPAPAGPYSNVVVAGDYAFIAGQIALDANGKLVGESDFHAQAVQSLKNVVLAAEAVGGAAGKIASLTFFIANYEPELLPALGKAEQEVLGAACSLPAKTLVGVAALGLPSWLIEIQATVFLGK